MSFLIVTKYLGPSDSRGSRVRATLVDHLQGKPVKVSAVVTSGQAPGDAPAWHRAAALKLLDSHVARRKAWARERGFDGAETARVVAAAETHDGTGYAFICEWDVT